MSATSQMKRYTSVMLIAVVVGIMMTGALAVAVPNAAFAVHFGRGFGGVNHSPCSNEEPAANNPNCQ